MIQADTPREESTSTAPLDNKNTRDREILEVVSRYRFDSARLSGRALYRGVDHRNGVTRRAFRQHSLTNRSLEATWRASKAACAAESRFVN